MHLVCKLAKQDRVARSDFDWVERLDCLTIAVYDDSTAHSVWYVDSNRVLEIHESYYEELLAEPS